jgi:hypothetical protein
VLAATRATYRQCRCAAVLFQIMTGQWEMAPKQCWRAQGACVFLFTSGCSLRFGRRSTHRLFGARRSVGSFRVPAGHNIACCALRSNGEVDSEAGHSKPSCPVSSLLSSFKALLIHSHATSIYSSPLGRSRPRRSSRSFWLFVSIAITSLKPPDPAL